MDKVSKKIFLKTDVNVLSEDVLKEITEDISFMQDEYNDPDEYSSNYKQTEYIISITVEERE